MDVRQVVMTLSEYERRTLDGIENDCRREDPAFADRMNLTVAQQRGRRLVVMAQCAIWIGWLMLMIGGGLTRGSVVHRGVRRLLRAHPDRDGSRRLAAQPKPANLDPVGSMRDCDGAPTQLSLGRVRPQVINTSRPPG
jgi:hypothetical protein